MPFFHSSINRCVYVCACVSMHVSNVCRCDHGCGACVLTILHASEICFIGVVSVLTEHAIMTFAHNTHLTGLHQHTTVTIDMPHSVCRMSFNRPFCLPTPYLTACLSACQSTYQPYNLPTLQPTNLPTYQPYNLLGFLYFPSSLFPGNGNPDLQFPGKSRENGKFKLYVLST